MLTTDRGDVVELLDRDGDAFAAYRYDEWGNPLGSGDHATGVWTQATTLIDATTAGLIADRQILRYAGYAYDAESGLYYCSARYYDPVTRQWTTKDEVKADGEESAYQYCSGDPIALVDGSGRAAHLIRFPKYREGLRARVGSYLHAVLLLNAGYAQERLMDNIAKKGVVSGFVSTWKWWFFDMVRGQRPWDLKLAAHKDWRDRKYLRFAGRLVSPEQFGNINIGYTAAALGVPLTLVENASFAAHVSHGWSWSWKDGYPKAKSLCPDSIKNELADEKWIRFGYNRCLKKGLYSRHTWFVWKK